MFPCRLLSLLLRLWRFVFILVLFLVCISNTLAFVHTFSASFWLFLAVLLSSTISTRGILQYLAPLRGKMSAVHRTATGASRAVAIGV